MKKYFKQEWQVYVTFVSAIVDSNEKLTHQHDVTIADGYASITSSPRGNELATKYFAEIHKDEFDNALYKAMQLISEQNKE